jgi:hypothetical protein
MVVEIHPERTSWEYHCLAVNKEDANKSPGRQFLEINKLGGEGWELVAVYPRQDSIDYVFKRQAPTTINTGVPRAGDE